MLSLPCATIVSDVQLSVVKKALLQHGLTESHNNTIISVIEMEAILATMFNNAKLKWSNINPEYCTEVTLNWILACYDRYNPELLAICFGACHLCSVCVHACVCVQMSHLMVEVQVGLRVPTIVLGACASLLPGTRRICPALTHAGDA